MRRRPLNRVVLLVALLWASGIGVAHAGIDVWTPIGPGGGIVTSLAIDPRTPTTVYAAVAGAGGVFKTMDGGGSWSRVNIPLTNVMGWPPRASDIRALAIDPSTPTTLYAGGFDGYVYKSTDGGAHWRGHLDHEFSAGGLMDVTVLALAIDPRTPTTVYAGTDTYPLFKSTDAAATWSFADTGLPAGVQSLAIDPSAPATLYAGTGGGGVFKSTDGAASWSPANNGLTSLHVGSLVIVSPTTLYAGTAGGGVFKSTDGGAIWSAVNTGLPAATSVLALAVDPAAPTTLYAGTLHGIFKSRDEGGSWSAVNTGLTNLSVLALAIDPVTPATLYAGTHGSGVFKSIDGGASWTAVNSGLTGTRIQALATDPMTPATIFAGTRGGGVFRSTDSGGSWSAANTGLTSMDVRALAIAPAPAAILTIDPAPPTTLYAGTAGGIFKSTTGGASWRAINTGLPEWATILAIAIDPETPTTLYAGALESVFKASVFKSIDGGESWRGVMSGVIVTSLAIADANTVYAAGISWCRDPGGPDCPDGPGEVDYTSVFKSSDAGMTWVSFLSYFDDSFEVLAIDPVTPSTLYAAGSSGLFFKSTDWSITGVGVAVRALVIDPATSTLYAGTSNGVLKSTNGGGSWSEMNAGLTNTFVTALAISPKAPTILYAGTDGGGVFAMPTAEVTPDPALGVSRTTVNVGGIVTVTVTDGPGNATDWVGLYRQGAADTEHGPNWQYLDGTKTPPGQGRTSATLTFTMPATPGLYEVRLFANDSYTRRAISPPVTVNAATLAVTPTRVEGGGTVIVTVSNGPGNATDWVGLVRQGAGDTEHGANWQYLDGTKSLPSQGRTSATLTLRMPTTDGLYEVRLFSSNSYTRQATSPPVEVTLPPVLTLTVTPTTVNAGGLVTVTVAGGPGNATDWVGLFRQGTGDTEHGPNWQYLDGTKTPPSQGQMSATLAFTMPAASGVYEVRFFPNNGYTLLATSMLVTVNAPTLAVNPTIVNVGDAVTVTVTDGNATDWVGLYWQGAADTEHGPNWQYLDGTKNPPGQGRTPATLTFTMTVNPGVYEFRLFANNGYTRLATSPPVTMR